MPTDIKQTAMDDNKQANISDKYLSSFFKIAVGLVVISIAFPFIVNHFFSNWQTSGTFGDTFGALNALFSGLAFAGVIVTILIQKSELENQRTELQLQRTEMQETRKEFLINRTTNLVYNQLDRFEKSLSELTISYNGMTYTGNDAISFLDDNKESVYRFDKLEEEYNAEMKAAIIKLLKIYTSNKSQIEKFAHTAYNSVGVLKRLIYKTDLEVEEINDLKNLFFVNIGFINMGVIERILEVEEDKLKFLKAEDFVSNDLDVGELIRAILFLKSIKEFSALRLTDENFAEQKKEWIKSNGNLS
jgi:hypothetical protein